MKQRKALVFGFLSVAIAASVAPVLRLLPHQFDEPALMGRVVDTKTKQPIEGVVIYGYYATQAGTWGGGKALVQMVRSFETKTNNEGGFELPAWRSESLKGVPMNLFPMIVFYKPGYEMRHEQMKSIREWVPYGERHDTPKIEPSGRINWLHLAHELRPVATERDRYAALNDSSVGLQFIGECGWEAYAQTLLVRHNELKYLIAKYVEPESIGADGYVKAGYFHKDPLVDYVNKSTVDQLIMNFREQQPKSKCSNPNRAFATRK
jgi:hypothetical protein